MCIGATVRLSVCGHKSYDANQLLWAKPEREGYQLLCERHAVPGFGPYFHVCEAGNCLPGDRRPVRNLLCGSAGIRSAYTTRSSALKPPHTVRVYTIKHMLMRVPFYHPVTFNDVDTALPHLQWDIRPHHRTADQEVREKLTQDRTSGTARGDHEDEFVSGRETHMSSVQCTHCMSKATFCRHKDAGYLLLTVRRETTIWIQLAEKRNYSCIWRTAREQRTAGDLARVWIRHSIMLSEDLR